MEKNQQILENKPYLTKKELSLLLQKKGKNLDKKITQLLKKNYLISLKKGLYTTRVYSLSKRGELGEYLANILSYPSYLSLEYVLQKENLIPEAVFAYTSVTLKLPRVFKNQCGLFIFRKIKESLFNGYHQVPFKENYQIKIAKKAKALFDYLYFKPLTTSSIEELLSDLRINWELFGKKDFAEFQKYTTLSKSKKMEKISQVLKEQVYGRQ